MARPLVAIVGRPNVGKSTFFNKMSGKRIAIVEDTPGVTRDRVYADCEWLNHKFTLIDTGGIDPMSDDPLLKQMRRQAEIAIETCDVILFFVDGKQGLTADDETVADMLRRSGKPVILVVNKIDNIRMMDGIYDFYQLGIGDPIGISSVNLLNLGDLLDLIVAHFPEESEEDEETSTISIAVVGKPNVGKSSLVNRILGEERVAAEGNEHQLRFAKLDHVAAIQLRGGEQRPAVQANDGAAAHKAAEEAAGGRVVGDDHGAVAGNARVLGDADVHVRGASQIVIFLVNLIGLSVARTLYAYQPADHGTHGLHSIQRFGHAVLGGIQVDGGLRLFVRGAGYVRLQHVRMRADLRIARSAIGAIAVSFGVVEVTCAALFHIHGNTSLQSCVFV